MDFVIVDTGVWFAIFDERDQHYKEGQEKAQLLEALQIIIPWPTLYETLCSKLVKKKNVLRRFEEFLKSTTVKYLDDEPYRDESLQLSFESSLREKRPLSMVDCLLRLLIDDVNVNVQYLATFNRRDFIDVCSRRGIEII
jgi:predicted nucleic acid-binding protein